MTFKIPSQGRSSDSSQSRNAISRSFDITGRVAVVTGGAGLLGVKHAEALAEMGALPILLDLYQDKAEMQALKISEEHSVKCQGFGLDISDSIAVSEVFSKIISDYGKIDILINNAANNPGVEDQRDKAEHWSRLENFPIDIWNQDLLVGLTGTFLCSRVAGVHMAKEGKGVILNIASDLALIAPDQRIYQKQGLEPSQQPVKPVTYSVVKSGVMGLTRYLATYWADAGVRVNALIPGGVYNGQPEDFVKKLTALIPLGRMANANEYKAAVAFLVSDASSYMTGAGLVMDGGRTCW